MSRKKITAPSFVIRLTAPRWEMVTMLALPNGTRQQGNKLVEVEPHLRLKRITRSSSGAGLPRPSRLLVSR